MKLRTKALVVGLLISIMLNLAIIFSAVFYNPVELPFEKFTGRGMGGGVDICVDWYINLSEVSPQVTKYGDEYRIDINLSEREDIYYPFLNFTDNTTLFEINRTTGVINFTANSSQMGQYIVNITVGNNACREPDDSMLFRINVTEDNFAPVINLTYNLTMYEDSPFYFNMSNFTYDPDNDALKFYDNYPNFVIGEDSGIIDWTPDDEDIGNWTVRFTVVDPGFLVDFQDVLMQVISVNDAPILSAIGAQTAQVNVSLNITLRGYDQDAVDALTFFSNTSWFLNSTEKINTSSNWAEYLLTIIITNNSWVNETFSINITVNDTEGASDSEVISFTVVQYNHPPNITSYYPLEKSISLFTGACQFFNITKYDEDGTIPSTMWYLDGNETAITLDGYTFCPSIAGTYNITVVITDGMANDSESWIITAAVQQPSSTTPSGAGGGGAGKFCEPSWVCTDWIWCQPGGIQTRICSDRNKCGSITGKPIETQSCIYTEFPTCFDGIKNQDEVAPDCGGSICKSCPTCDDGIQNQGEDAIDCGGPCPVCKELLAPSEVKPIAFAAQQIVANLNIYWMFWLLVSILMLSMVRAVREVNVERIMLAAKRKDPVPKVNKLLKLSYKEIKANNHEKAKEYYNEAKELYEKLSDSDKKRVKLKENS
ncbi:MAG: hypothetical protein PHO02_03880 [Candidatus Nanoarchaeia archaeon]|nr:hypothetical protein [Candidatus Nanoarchaeia archaeon]